MYVLIFALVAVALAAMAFISNAKTESSQMAMAQLSNQSRVVAEQGAEVFFACAGESVGTYTESDLIAANKLPAGYPQTTPYGNAWVCKVASGGVGGGNVVLVTWDGAPQSAGAFGVGALSGSALQTQVAWTVASLLVQQIESATDADVGVVQPGSTTLVSDQTELQYTLTGLLSAPSYATPVIEKGLASNSSS